MLCHYEFFKSVSTEFPVSKEAGNDHKLVSKFLNPPLVLSPGLAKH